MKAVVALSGRGDLQMKDGNILSGCEGATETSASPMRARRNAGSVSPFWKVDFVL